ncbi:ester cyclase [Actinomadura sp. NAK00032]|uniref:ester cyclase n=1 Tax=Actinomadura sp. NAK00032 TaxID=2742128 RepID=UPI0015926A3F|nr:ester cyclase [Actinomadura sp. NAK00032]QKW38429.1 ester cyclase [Actinomadura sp. NAK00032]
MVTEQTTAHKETARRFIEEDELGDRVQEYGELCTADYVEHDPSMPHESVGLAEARENYGELSAAFALRHRVDSMIAERELVAQRFTVRGRHVGEYRGLPPTGRTFEVTGQVTYRFQDGRIAESWFNVDMEGLREQLAIES